MLPGVLPPYIASFFIFINDFSLLFNIWTYFTRMFVNAIIAASEERVTALPSDAIVSFDDREYIFIFEKNKEEGGKPFTEYRMIEIKKGITDDGYTQIILPEGFDAKSAKVVVTGAYNLLSAKKNAGEMAC